MAARLAEPEPDPDRAVAAGGADLERLLDAFRRREHAQEPPVFLRHGELPFVGGPDALEDLFDGRRQIAAGLRRAAEPEADREKKCRHTHAAILPARRCR